jgi:hypothetical protein
MPFFDCLIGTFHHRLLQAMNEPQRRALHEQIGPLIRVVRSQRVILDSDLARLYGVSAKRLNEQVRRNRERFPQDVAFRLTRAEWVAARSQIAAAISQTDENKADAGNWSQFATSSILRRGTTYRAWVFTEHGALQAANVLNSPRAVAMSVYVIRAFIKMREDLAADAVILKRLAEIDKTLLLHDAALRDIYLKLRPLLDPPPPAPRPEIGFHVKEDAVRYRVGKKPARL